MASKDNEATRLITEDVARMISRRGQTIYGRKVIVDLQIRAGVSLHDDSSFESYSPNSMESLNRFLIEYAKLSPASRLTVMILAYQNGLTLPDEITKRKKSFLEKLREPMSFFDNL